MSLVLGKFDLLFFSSFVWFTSAARVLQHVQISVLSLVAGMRQHNFLVAHDMQSVWTSMLSIMGMCFMTGSDCSLLPPWTQSLNSALLTQFFSFWHHGVVLVRGDTRAAEH